jgi:hypothetical protein
MQLQSPFASTDRVFDGEAPSFKQSGDGFKIVEDIACENGNHEVTYQIRTSLEVVVEAISEDQVKELCASQLYEFLDIVDVGSEDVIGTQNIEIDSVQATI